MSKKVLLVDDAGVMRQAGAMTLKNSGYTVTQAVDGKDALAKAEGEQFDIIVTDINMPEMNGIELIKELRKKEAYKFTPIVVLSTLSMKDKVEEGKEAGASGWIFKPFKAAELVKTVKKFLP